MPYIKPEDRTQWKSVIEQIELRVEDLKENEIEGNLNYLITSILKRIYPPKYYQYNKVMGLLECIKQEFYRKVIGPYEDTKIKENGDVE